MVATFATWLLLTATPAQCEQLWPAVFAALQKEPQPFDRSPLAKRVANASEKLRTAWLAGCRAFTPEVVACATGAQLEVELAQMRRTLEAEKKATPAEIERILARVRADWSIFECKAISQSLDAAAKQVAIDAGLEKP